MDILRKMRLKDVMDTKVITVSEDDDLAIAHDKFIVHGVFYICVTDSDEKLTGLLSHKYLYRAQSPRRIIEGQNVYDKNIVIDGDSYFDKSILDGYHLKTIMKRDPFTMRPDDSIAAAITNMARRQIGCIPVVNEYRKIEGIVTNQDVVHLISNLLNQ